MTTVTARPKTEANLKKAVHHPRLASKRGLLERLFTLWFRGFVYNQIWEDPRVDLPKSDCRRIHETKV